MTGKYEGNNKPREEVLSLVRVMPANVKAGQVIGLVEVIGDIGSPADASRVADELGADIASLLPWITAAEMLGLLKSEKGDIHLTESGQRFQKASKHKIRLVKDELSDIEPFKTALKLASQKKAITSRDVTETLLRKDLHWHHETELNEAVVQDLLVHWGIYAGLLSYDGKTGKFQKCP